MPSYSKQRGHVCSRHAVVSCRFGGGAEPHQNHIVKGAGRTANQNYGLLACAYHHSFLGLLFAMVSLHQWAM